MAIFELAGLTGLQRLSLVRVQKLTDNAVFFLAEHAKGLERLHLSYCDHLSLSAMMLLLRKLPNLQHLTTTGVPSFKRKGIKRFSDPPPSVCLTLMMTCSVLLTLALPFRPTTRTRKQLSEYSAAITFTHCASFLTRNNCDVGSQRRAI